MHRLWPGIVALSLLAAVACAPTAPPSPAAAPPRPTEKPAAAAAPAQPTPQPAAKPTEKPAAKPTEKPAAKPTEKPAARPEDIKVPKPSGNLAIKAGHPSSISFYEAPQMMTHERLNKDGWKIEDVLFTRTDLGAIALNEGKIDLYISVPLDPLRAIQKGGKLRWLTENNPGEFVLIAKTSIARCEDLNGKRLALHNEVGNTTLLTKQWILSTCKATPNYLIIPGGENRVVALMNDQVDATYVQLGDWLGLDAQAPGKFHVLTSGEAYKISGSGFWANTEWLQKNADVATAYVAELLKTYRMIAANPKLLEEVVPKYVPDLDRKVLPTTIKAYLDIGSFPANGGDLSMLEGGIRFFQEQGELQPGLEAGKIADSTVLQNALKIIGKVPGQR
ncbi:MAG: ABC transporter substrate-binding protein [Chloroflexi bacterium]|nr:ABC transporter substrate-binding protein [Chloroflexota bacterium]